MIERHVGGVHGALAVVGSDGGIRVRSAPTLDPRVVVALDEIRLDRGLGSVLRFSTGTVTSFPALSSDERWRHVVEASPDLEEATCWAMLAAPAIGRGPLGALFVFAVPGREPTALERQVLERAMNLAAIAIERRNFEAELEHQARHDDLTGLPNRAMLLDRIGQGLVRASRHGTHVSVLFVDLDQFKVANDSLGHAVGDEFLVQVAERLAEPLELGDTLGRFGGDEFLVVSDRLSGEDEAVELAETLAGQLREPFALDETEVFVSASIGIAVSVTETTSAEALIRDADVAMYRAKEDGRDRYRLFHEDLHMRMLERHELEQDLRVAIEREQFELHYQPLIDLGDGAVAGLEALIRWVRPGRGLIEPSAFIPLAEETGLIVPLGEWVVREALRQAARWPCDAHGSRLSTTINLSSRQLAHSSLIDLVATELVDNELDPGAICLEITESALMDDVDRAVATLEKLKGLGVQVAIDDFGTGYATLDYLRRFTMADYLKIDRSFVEGVDQGGSKEMAIVAGAVALAKSLGFIVVAEGVRTEGQLAALRGLGCDLAQGYYFSRPVPVTAAMDLAARTDDRKEET
ncbi:MAG: EAL domain-containing protein [Acidimicrobiia bacterium]|nr:EAL domain-containing protein [Acidimicrobiia bacterium]